MSALKQMILPFRKRIFTLILEYNSTIENINNTATEFANQEPIIEENKNDGSLFTKEEVLDEFSLLEVNDVDGLSKSQKDFIRKYKVLYD